MTLIVCLDQNNGMRFNKRRQSTDKRVISHILETHANKTIAVRPYSAKLFSESRILVVDKPAENDIYFLEEAEFIPNLEKVGKVIIYRWDKVYPADEKFPFAICFEQFRCEKTDIIRGNSHELISLEVYKR